jgi:beta-mannosidase
MKDTNINNSNFTRRHFIKQSSLAAGALAIPGLMPSFLVNRSPQDSSLGVLDKLIITEGWKIKSFSSGITLSAKDLSESTRADDKDGWLQVPVMPAMVHEILLHHKKIEDPVQPFGMEKCYWVSEKDWVYSVNFSAKKTAGENRLVFNGLKGPVRVYLNGKQIADHKDMSIPLVIDISGSLRSSNSLVLHFKKVAPDVKAGDPDPSIRKSAGSYLGPNPMLYTSGVFDSVFIENTDGSLMSEIVTDFSVSESLKNGNLAINVSGRSRFPSVKLQVNLFGPDSKLATESTIPANVINGNFNGKIVLDIKNPELWWPRGYGAQKLYKAEIVLIIEGKAHQKEYRTIGFRRITMPERLHFVVNGVPVILLGGVWVTPNLLSDVYDQQREERLFDMAENANFNAFRIWDPSPTEPHNQFYEMADKRGFLLWNDFPKLPMGPDKKSIDACTEKAARVIKKIKHHPSILSWCGCNESAQWAHEDYNSDFTDHGPWQGLPAAEAVGEVCKKLDPDRYYQPSTPYFGMDPNDPREGNTHGYTNMWFVPGYDYLNFASEDTRIAAPPLNSMKRFMKPEEIFPAGYSTLVKNGNNYPFPATWLPFTTSEASKKTGPVEQLFDATDDVSLINRIGIAEGMYYQDTVERQRRGRRATEAGDRRSCGGYLVWKFNDSWTEIYSAKVDYFLEPYHAYYFLKRAYAPVLLSFDIDTFIYLWVVNDSMETVSGTVKIQLYHLGACQFRKEIIKEISVTPGKSLVAVQLDKEGIRAFRKEHILFAKLTDKNNNIIARADSLTDIERRLNFPDARLNIKVENNSVVITTDKFARNINLEGDANGDSFGWFFEDNYFDLLPGEIKTVRILGKHPKGKITAKAWYSSNSTTIDWQKV